jgi:hypothetical protein
MEEYEKCGKGGMDIGRENAGTFSTLGLLFYPED